MIVKVLASGSGGNVIAVRSVATTILVDAGEAKTRIEKLLLENSFDPLELKAIYVTHGHKDHAYGISFANKYKIPVYASEGSWKEKNYMAKVEQELREVVYDGCMLTCEDMMVLPFNVSHDDYQPLGYTIQNKSFKISICLDTGIVTKHMLYMMQNSDMYVIESNHDESMLEVAPTSKYPDWLKARIMSDIGHLNNQQCADALSKLVQGKGERIILTHLSSNNNDRDLAAMTVATALMKKGLKEGQHYHLEVL